MIVFLVLLVLVAVVLQHWMGSAAAKQVACSIRADRYLVEPGEPFELIITLSNRSRLPVFFLQMRCSVPSKTELCSHGAGRLSESVNVSRYSFHCFLMPRQTLEHRVSIRLTDRGFYTFGSLRIYAGDFLGIRESDEERIGNCEVVVLPKRITGVDISSVSGGLIGEHSVTRWIHEDPVLSVGFREYTGREPQKSINWNRSLQSQKLMVRQFDHTAEERATVLFSLWQGEEKEFEHCLSLGRTLCEDLEKAHIPFAFLHNSGLTTVIGQLPPVEAGLGLQHLNMILEGLGRCVPNSNGQLLALVRSAIGRAQTTSCYLLVVPHTNAETARLAGFLQASTGCDVRVISGEAVL